MSQTTETEGQIALSEATMEAVLGTGDLTKLTPKQRVEYMTGACRALGLNPLTRPFRFLKLGDQIQLYATKDCAELRRIHKINLRVVDKSIDGDLFTVTVRAKTPDGREDEDMGAVNLGQARGDVRANQIMRAITKAKRRVTMSICGLGFLDETEVETIPGAYTFDADANPPTTTVAQHKGPPMPALGHDDKPMVSYPPQSMRAAAQEIASEKRGVSQTDDPPGVDPRWEAWIGKLRIELATAQNANEVEAIRKRDTVKHAIETAPRIYRNLINDAFHDTYERLAEVFPQISEEEIAARIGDSPEGTYE